MRPPLGCKKVVLVVREVVSFTEVKKQLYKHYWDTTKWSLNHKS